MGSLSSSSTECRITLRPFKLMPVVKELGRTRLAVHVNLRSLYGPTTVANEVRVHIPMPKLTARANVNVTAGKAKYARGAMSMED